MCKICVYNKLINYFKFHSQSKGGTISLFDMTLCKFQSLKVDDPGFCKVATFDYREFNHSKLMF